MPRYITQQQLDDFTSAVETAPSFDDVAAICLTLSKNIEDSGKSISTRKNTCSEYRKPFNTPAARALSKALRREVGASIEQHAERALKAIEGGFWSGSDDVLRAALVLAIVNVSPAALEEFNARCKDSTESKQSDNAPLIEPLHYITKARSMLQSPYYMHLTVGLCAVTGRRQYEILSTAEFKKIGNAAIHFTGRAKQKGNDDDFNMCIPTLVPADEVVSALSALRAKRPNFVGADVSVTNGANSKDINQLARRELGHFGLKTLHSARGIYAKLCHVGFNKMRSGANNYYERLLAHSDSNSASDYEVFALDTDEFKPLQAYCISLMTDDFEYSRLPNPIEKI